MHLAADTVFNPPFEPFADQSDDDVMDLSEEEDDFEDNDDDNDMSNIKGGRKKHKGYECLLTLLDHCMACLVDLVIMFL